MHSSALPTFSIIIPTYARPQQLTACLQALAQLEYPCERFEVIIVDDGSEVPLDVLVKPFAPQLNVTVIRQSHAGPATARNTGAARATGQFLAFTDDDCAPAPDWLHTLAMRFAQTPEDAVGGQILNALPDNPYSTASQLVVSYIYTYYNAVPTQAQFCTSNNLTVPADRFRTIGGFDTTFPYAAAEDREFCARWLHTGYKMTYAPEVVVYHAHPLTLRSFSRQHFNYGREACRFFHLRARRNQSLHRLKPLGVYLRLTQFLSAQVRSGQASLPGAFLVPVAQGIYAAGMLWEEHRRRRTQTAAASVPRRET